MTELEKAVSQLAKKMKGNESEAKPPTIQYCSIELYEVSDSYDCKQILQNIKTSVVSDKGAYIIAFHDKDVYTENTFDSNKRLIGKKGDKKSSHYHVLLRLPYRMYRCDLAKTLGIEERWILKLKSDKDFDNMIFYVTHEKYDESIKKHYNYNEFDTNVIEYVDYIVNVYRGRLAKSSHIITDFISFAYSVNDRKISYQMFYKYLLDEGYSMSDIKDYYNQLRDILQEHNRDIDSPQHTQHIIDKAKMEENIKHNKMFKLVDTFGTTTIENDSKTYVLTNAKIKKGKK